MRQIEIAKLVENALTLGLYSEDEVALEQLMDSITLFGVLEPLVVSECPTSPGFYDIVSGNRRKQAAQSIGLTHVPCMVIEPIEIDEPLIRAFQEQRIKKLSDLLREVIVLNEKYGNVLKQGVKASNNPLVGTARSVRAALVDRAGGKHVLTRLLKFHVLAEKLSDGNPDMYKQYLKQLDSGKSLMGTIKSLERSDAENENLKRISNVDLISVGDVKIYRKSSDSPSEIEPQTIQLLVTSPPYFDLRDYKLGTDELGHESESKHFIDRLVEHLNVYKDLLKEDGTMWINMGDFVQGYGYSMIAEQVALGLINRGWLLHDKFIWAKTNPQFTNAGRSVLAHEYIYVLKKRDFVKYDMTWIRNYPEVHGLLTTGTPGGRIKLKSTFDLRDNILSASTANNASLKSACKSQGIHLTHNATFPLSVPIVAILTATDPQDLVVDPFNGTATTGRVAQILNRKYIGYELNPTYVKMSEIRLLQDLSVDVDFIEAA